MIGAEARDKPAGGEAELEAFLQDVERRAYQMAVLATRDRDEALDLVQDAMTRLVSRYRHRPAPEWRPLFYRILHNRIMDWHRRSKVQSSRRLECDPEIQELVLSQAPDPAEPGPEHRLQASVALGELEQAVARLPGRQRQALLLRAWEGLSVAETARVMGCTQGSVKTHYFRALQSLREIGEEHL